MPEKAKQKKIKASKKIIKLDIACGNLKQKDHLGVDISKDTKADFIWDLTKYPWEFVEDASVNEIFCAHFVEHIPRMTTYDDGLFHFMDECYRILKKGGKMTIICPYYTSHRAWGDATHTRAINEMSFLYFNEEWRNQKFNDVKHYPIHCNFIMENVNFNINPQWQGKSQEALQYALQHNWNVADDIIVTLKKV